MDGLDGGFSGLELLGGVQARARGGLVGQTDIVLKKTSQVSGLVGIQLKILLGFLVLFLTIQLLPYVSDFVLTEMKRMVTGIASGMHG